jgi:hypothetical protein
MHTKLYRFAWMISMIVAASMACSLFSGISKQVTDVKETAQSVATGVQEGQHLITTAKALATEVGGSGLLKTAQSAATEVGQSGIVETAKAVATEQGPEILGTIEAVATDQGPGLLETMKAVVTDQGPGLLETGQAFATQFASGEAPADIPLVEGDREDFTANDSLVSYSTSLQFADVVGFYKTQMPENGWTIDEQSSVETGSSAILNYSKADRTALVIINADPANNKTLVAITIQAK